MLRRLLDCCRRVASGDAEAITAFIARFLTRLLHTIGVDSLAASRAQSPRLVHGGNDDNTTFNLFDQEVSTLRKGRTTDRQDDFLRIFSAPIPDAHEMDDQFW